MSISLVRDYFIDRKRKWKQYCKTKKPNATTS